MPSSKMTKISKQQINTKIAHRWQSSTTQMLLTNVLKIMLTFIKFMDFC